MKRFCVSIVSLGALGIFLAWGSSAQAQGFGYGGYGGFFGFNAGAGPYNLYDNDRVVPHFALYPPVYYSQPVPRPYGWSPFAYPPGVMTPDIAPPEPAKIENPHAPQKTSTGAPAVRSNRSAQAPLTIDNPYYVQAAQPAGEQLSNLDR